ncbi:HNH endonuclease [Lacticigenium naphthae]|uniref:HNH endonuclease n=1 Tax=Lacticigenium naphthae TaxID=515351 RepID=UPI000418AB5F|nr:HNH endonuclease signature motif containing protein [Lacticigenium naphthae]
MSIVKRDAIPEKIKREVRQYCKFGCIFCGNPLIEYHHIIPWHEVKIHSAANLTCLCSNCHTMVTKGLISNQEVIYKNKNPHNKGKDFWPSMMLGYKIFNNEDIAKLSIGVANSYFKMNPLKYNSNFYLMVPIVIDGVPLIAFTVKEGRLNLYLKLFDEYNKVVLEIINNEIVSRLDFWDITFKNNRLKINNQQNKIFIEIEFEVPYSIHIKKGFLMYNQKGYKIRSDSLVTLKNNIQFSNNEFYNFSIGIAMGEIPGNMSCAVRLP